MPELSTNTLIVQALIVLIGGIFLWRLVLSPAARQRSLTTPQPLPHWDIPGYSFCFSVVRVIAVIVGTQILTLYLLEKYWPELPLDRGLGLVIAGLSLQVGLLLGLGVSWLFLHSARFQAKINAAHRGGAIPPPPLPWKQVPLAGVATFFITVAVVAPVSYLWLALLEIVGYDAPPQTIAQLFSQADSPAQQWLLIFFAVIFAPITEELAFRFGIFRFARGRLPRLWSHVLPALIFAAAHPYVVVIVPLFVFALIQSAAYERTGRLAVPMIAHALFNCLSAVSLLSGLEGST